MKHTDLKSLTDWLERKVVQDAKVTFYFALSGNGRTREKDKTSFTYPPLPPVSTTETGAMRPGYTYLIVASDKERCQFVCPSVESIEARTVILDNAVTVRNKENVKDDLTFLSDQLMRGVQINERMMANIEKLTTMGDNAHEKQLNQARTIAEIQEKQAGLQERLDKTEGTQTTMKGLLIVANKIVDRILVGKEAQDKEINDALQLARLLNSEGITPSAFREGVEGLKRKGVSLSDLVGEGLSKDTEQDTEQVEES